MDQGDCAHELEKGRHETKRQEEATRLIHTATLSERDKRGVASSSSGVSPQPARARHCGFLMVPRPALLSSILQVISRFRSSYQRGKPQRSCCPLHCVTTCWLVPVADHHKNPPNRAAARP
ncbi:hypothetical protein BT93_K2248 [Corymbia citriodora subsp. variegata]|nr:hypothetical protein BT93_K2248 [Corymbia citriodora subsp. variegata]